MAMAVGLVRPVTDVALKPDGGGAAEAGAERAPVVAITNNAAITTERALIVVAA
jgi:hypothetical protein